MSRAEDLAGRAAAQTRFTGTLVLEAGAGTGKTTTLVARILAWTLGRGWQEAAEHLAPESTDDDTSRVAAEVLDGVVAITFTEAAAAEMAQRVAQALAAVAAGRESAIRGFDPGLLPQAAARRRRERSRALLGALERLTIETIHAFCRRLLTRTSPGGRHPPADPSRRRPALDRGDRLRRRRGSGAAGLRRRPESPARPSRRLRSGPRPDPRSRRSPGPRRRAGRGSECGSLLHRRLRGALPRALRRSGTFLSAGGEALRGVGGRSSETVRGLDLVGGAAEEALAAATSGAEAVEEWVRPLQDAFDDPLWDRLKAWSKGDFNKGESGAIGDRAGACSAAAGELRPALGNLRDLQPVAVDVARRALAPLLAEVHRRADARGALAFASLLREAHDLLEGNERLRAAERRRIRQLLVDEFQDTDPLQCDLVRWLALEGGDERPGLFLVGDPKQSIFGWRSADLAAYHGFVSAALEAGGERYRLVRNFRSLPAVLHEVSRVVGPLMVFQEGLQPEFQELEAALAEDKAQGPAQIEYWISWERSPAGRLHTEAGARGEGVHRLEAAAVAAALREAHERGVPWSEMAVLFRYRTAFDTYLEVLRDGGVPFVVARDRQYYHRREVIEATALVHAVVDPSDHLSALAYLRSAWSGLPDAALLPLWRRELPRWLSELDGPQSPAIDRLEEILGEVARGLPASVPGLDRIAGWEVAVGDALRALGELRAAYRALPADRFVRLLRRRTLMDPTEAARYQGRYRLANLDLLFRRLESAAEEQGHDLSAILRTLRRSLEETPDAPEAQPKDAGEDAVQVMTVHTAKGLEFRHVYLVETHHVPQQSDEERWDPALPGEYRLFARPTPGYHRLAARRRRIRALEEVRTLYVALTRPIERLVVVGHWSEGKEPRSVERARSLLDLVENHPEAPASLVAWARQAEEAGTDRLERGGVAWRFLGLSRGPSSRTDEPPSAPASFDVAGARRAFRELAARRTEAQMRRALPFGRAASAEAGARLAALSAAAPGDGPEEADEGARDAALLAGSAVHRLFQTWDREADAGEEWTRQREAVVAWLRSTAPAASLEAASARAEALLDRLERGRLLPRFQALGDRIVARELPVLLPPDDGAVGYVAGAVDLVHRDDDGRLVIVDFKTDRVETDEDLAARARAYAPQEALYARAVGEALGLETPPRTELWFLWPDRVWPET
ncbi:MAG: UvrD-helicase domain-containing protein [Thermoanaerobaculia bacterium]